MLAVQMIKFDLTESSDQILLVIMLHIWNLRYSKHVWIIKCVGFESIIFAINLNFAKFDLTELSDQILLVNMLHI